MQLPCSGKKYSHGSIARSILYHVIVNSHLNRDNLTRCYVIPNILRYPNNYPVLLVFSNQTWIGFNLYGTHTFQHKLTIRVHYLKCKQLHFLPLGFSKRSFYLPLDPRQRPQKSNENQQ